MSELIDAVQLSQLAGGTTRQIEYLVRVGVITPAVPAPRRGMSRKFSVDVVDRTRLAIEKLSQRKDISAAFALLAPPRKPRRPYRSGSCRRSPIDPLRSVWVVRWERPTPSGLVLSHGVSGVFTTKQRAEQVCWAITEEHKHGGESVVIGRPDRDLHNVNRNERDRCDLIVWVQREVVDIGPVIDVDADGKALVPTLQALVEAQ